MTAIRNVHPHEVQTSYSARVDFEATRPEVAGFGAEVAEVDSISLSWYWRDGEWKISGYPHAKCYNRLKSGELSNTPRTLTIYGVGRLGETLPEWVQAAIAAAAPRFTVEYPEV